MMTKQNIDMKYKAARAKATGQAIIAFAHGVLEIISALAQIRERAEGVLSPDVPRDTLPAAPAPTADEERLAQEKSREIRMTMFTGYRDHLWALRQSNIEHSDNLILTLSAAILALSVSFVKDIVPLARAAQLGCLVGSWALLSAAITSTLTSYWFGRRDMDLQIDFAEQYYVHEKAEFFNKPNRWKKMTGWCNTVSAWAFSLGVVLLVYFVSLNLWLEKGYQDRLTKTAPVSTTAAAPVTSPRKGTTIKP